MVISDEGISFHDNEIKLASDYSVLQLKKWLRLPSGVRLGVSCFGLVVSKIRAWMRVIWNRYLPFLRNVVFRGIKYISELPLLVWELFRLHQDDTFCTGRVGCRLNWNPSPLPSWPLLQWTTRDDTGHLKNRNYKLIMLSIKRKLTRFRWNLDMLLCKIVWF